MRSDLRWMIPASIGAGALIAFFQPEFFATGWLVFSLVILLGLAALVALWRWAGGGRTLAWIIALAFLLRLATGIALTTLLPVYGSDSEQSKDGYIFTDSWRRDRDAWALAKSDFSILSGLRNEEFSGDQYGGLMAVSAFAYRYLSPDAHRPMLIILMAALVSAMAIPFLWKAVAVAWGVRIAIPAAWILALYPESILLGSSQMREPFLITFIAMTIWGFVDWFKNHQRSGWAWFAVGIAGMLLFSPGVALLALIMSVGWYWFSGEHRRFSRWILATITVVFIVGIFLVSSVLSETTLSAANPYSVITTWFYDAAKWDLYLLTESSGMVQYLLGVLPKPLHAPFFWLGMALPSHVLPANLFEPTIVISRIYWQPARHRMVCVVASASLWLNGGVEMLQSSRPQGVAVVWFRHLGLDCAGSPSEPALTSGTIPATVSIMLPWQAMFAAYAWSFWREVRDRWLPRIVAVEVSFPRRVLPLVPGAVLSRCAQI